MSFCLQKLSGVWYYRQGIPRDLIKYFTRSEIKKSLRTRVYSSAKTLVKPLLHKTERVFTLLRSGMLDDNQRKQIIAEYINDMLGEMEKHRNKNSTLMEFFESKFHGEGRFNVNEHNLLMLEKLFDNKSYENIKEVISYFKNIISSIDNSLITNNIDDWTRHKVKRLVNDNSLQIELPSELYFNPNEPDYNKTPPSDFLTLCREMLKADKKIYSIEIERLKGNYDNEYDRFLASQFESKPKKKLSELWAIYKDKKLEQGKWNLSTLEKNKGAFDTILDILGDRYLDALEDERIFIDFLKNLKTYPKYNIRQKKSKYKSNPTTIQPLSNASITFTTNLLSSLIKFAADNKKKWGIDVNHAKGLVTKDKRKPSELKSEYTKSDIEGLFKGLSKLRIRVEPEKYWIPLIALYSGARQNEICQLRTEDIELIGDIWIIKIKHAPLLNQTTKNKQTRFFPVHPTLKKLGFIKYVEHQKKEQQDRLFQNLEMYNAKWNKDFGKWYNRTFEPYFISKDSKKSFHSIRHTFVNWFKQNVFTDNSSLENLSIVKSIVGHMEKGELSILGLDNDITLNHYGKDYNLQKQLNLLKQLDYKVDLSLLERQISLK